MAKTTPKKGKKAASPAKKASPKPKERKKRAKKDPNAPKKALSAYMIWLMENRASISKPGMGVADVARAAGVEWGKLKPTDKTKWEKKAADDKKRYEKEMTSYKGTAGAATKKSPKKK